MNAKEKLEASTVSLKNVLAEMYSLTQDNEEKNFLFWHLKVVEGWLGDIHHAQTKSDLKRVLEDATDKYVRKYLCNLEPAGLNKKRVDLLKTLISSLEAECCNDGSATERLQA